MDYLVFVVRFADSSVPSILPATLRGWRTATDILTGHGTSLSMDVFVFEDWAAEGFVSTGINVRRALWKRWTPALEVAPDGALLTIESFISIDG